MIRKGSIKIFIWEDFIHFFLFSRDESGYKNCLFTLNFEDKCVKKNKYSTGNKTFPQYFYRYCPR